MGKPGDQYPVSQHSRSTHMSPALSRTENQRPCLEDQQSLEVLLSSWKQELTARRKRFHMWQITLLVGPVSASVLITLCGSSVLKSIGTLFLVLSFALTYFLLSAGRSESYTTMAAIAKCKDYRTVGALIEALDPWEPKLASLAAGALINMLPNLRMTDTLLLTAGHRQRLYRALMGKNSELVLATLKSLEQIGDRKAIPYIEVLARGKGLARKNQHIKQAALECLSFLQEQHSEEFRAQMLLHPTVAPCSADTLVRPACQEFQPDASVLLRPKIQSEEVQTPSDQQR